MAFVMDRALQRDLLERMREVFPDIFGDLPDLDWDIVSGHLAYLEGHGLCDAGLSRT